MVSHIRGPERHLQADHWRNIAKALTAAESARHSAVGPIIGTCCRTNLLSSFKRCLLKRSRPIIRTKLAHLTQCRRK
jgi:hypothetical protein